jgi:PPOX class probable FMN-dependent enzyme
LNTITSLAHLRALIGDPLPVVERKFHTQLNAAARAFIARAPLAFLATADAEGRPCVSPKGDAPGVATIESDTVLLLPERKGNRLVYSLQNVLGNPAVELLFVVPRTSETLRIQGRATLIDDADLCARLHSRGRPAILVMRIVVARCYFHCAKSLLRAGVWDPATWGTEVPVSFGCEIAEEGGLDPSAVPDFDAGVRERYRQDV